MSVIEKPLGKPKPTKESRPKKTKRKPINKMQVLVNKFGVDVVERAVVGFTFIKCECGCGNYAHDLHHCFIPDDKYLDLLSDERNLVYVNHDEHIARKFDNREWRIKFWKIQCDRYGEAAMLEWVNSLPEKMRTRIDWLND